MKVKTKSCSIALVSEFLIFLIFISSTASASTVLNSSSNGSFAYITNETSDNVSVIDTTTNTVTTNVTGIVKWQKCLGGSSIDYGSSIEQTSDGGYIVAGYSSSTDGDVTGNHGFSDYWVVKLDADGNIVWQKCLGGWYYDEARSIQQISDGGYIVAGYTFSDDGNVTGNHGNSDYWVVKLDANGNIVWQKCLGGWAHDEAYSIQQTSDGGYIVAGKSDSNDGDVTGNHRYGYYDCWVVKLDANGNIVWQKCFGGSDDDCALSIQQTSEGGYIVAGYTFSNDGNVTGNHGSYDYWIVKLDANGNIVWQKCLGGSCDDTAFSIQQTSDGGYIVAGSHDYSGSNDANVTGNHGHNDYWVIKFDADGNIVWQECLGGSWDDRAYSIQQTSDGGYIVAGESDSNDGDVTGYHENVDSWVVKLDANGSIVWQKCLGGSYYDEAHMGYDQAHSIEQTSDGGYIVAGESYSNDGDVTGNHGNGDYWVVKINTNALVSNFSAIPISGIAPLKVSFTDQSAESPTSWSWDFGDENTSTEQNPVHIYSAAGSYPVNLTVSNEKGTDSKSATINVYEKTILPVANFTSKQTGVLAVQFNDTSSNSPDEWNWEFGDGSTSTDANPTHTYAAAKTYAVNLTVSNADGSDAASKKITVTKKTGTLKARFKAVPLFGRAPLTVKFTDNSVNAASIKWDFGDGATSTKRNPLHTYITRGFYTVKFTTTNGDNSSTASKTIYVAR